MTCSYVKTRNGATSNLSMPLSVFSAFLMNFRSNHWWLCRSHVCCQSCQFTETPSGETNIINDFSSSVPWSCIWLWRLAKEEPQDLCPAPLPACDISFRRVPWTDMRACLCLLSRFLKANLLSSKWKLNGCLAKITLRYLNYLWNTFLHCPLFTFLQFLSNTCRSQ